MPFETDNDGKNEPSTARPTQGDSASKGLYDELHAIFTKTSPALKNEFAQSLRADSLGSTSGDLPNLQIIDSASSIFNSEFGRNILAQTQKLLNESNSNLQPKLGPHEDPKVQPKLEPREDPGMQPKLEPRENPRIQPKLGPREDPRIQPKLEPKPDRYEHLRTVDGYRSDQHPDLNLDIRGYQKVNAGNHLIDMGGDEDDKAPQLASLFSRDHGVPVISNTYAVNDWNWGSMSRGPQLSQYDATMVGFAAKPGENLYLPKSGYQIDQAGHQAKILYVDGDSITVNYTAEGTVAPGYTVHIKGIDVDPNLKEGDRVKAGQPLGKSNSSEVKVSIRDTGTFMDPRVRKDWWRSYDQP